MLSQPEQSEFASYLRKWLDFGSSRTEENIDELKENINWIYRELDLDEPLIIPCLGPIPQVIFPPLIELMLMLGKDSSVKPQFGRAASTEQPAVIAEWRNFWKEAHASIDWNKAPEDTGIGELLNARIERRIEKTLKNKLTAVVDQEFGMEEHLEYESLGKRVLDLPYHRLRFSLSLTEEEQEGIWQNMMLKLPASSVEILKESVARNKESAFLMDRQFVSSSMRSWMGGWDWYWMATSDYCREKRACKVTPNVGKQLNVWTTMACSATSYLFCERCCFIYFSPREVSFDDSWRLHHARKAAVDFIDGTKFFMWHGIEVYEEVIRHPEKIKLKAIESEQNVEVRRVMIERYGIDNFTRTAKKVQEDEYGALFMKEMRGDEPFVVVKVLNSTPEPDGSFKTYFLRVPPDTATAREGIAWTFGLEEDDYRPSEES